MAQLYLYEVEFRYTEGMFRGKRVVPKNDTLSYVRAKFETYHDNQLRVIISKKLQEYGTKVPYIVDIRILSKVEI